MDGSQIPVWQAFVLLGLAFYLLAKGADWLVDGSVGIAERFGVPKLLVGIVLLGFATTAPEFAVSFLSALSGMPEMALGNAVGSVIVDDGLALALVGIISTAPVLVERRLLLQAGVFLIVVDLLAFAFVAFDSTLSRAEGGVLLAIFFVYLGYVLLDRWKRPVEAGVPAGEIAKVEEEIAGRGLPFLLMVFLLGLGLVVGASEVVVTCAERVSVWAGIPTSVVALTVVAIGTSLPEIATCIQAARKGHGALAVGDIVGADVLNIAWIAGASAVANPLSVHPSVVWFMFPSMVVVVATMLGGLVIWRKMTRPLGCVLVAEYAAYSAAMFYLAFVARAFPVPGAH